MSQGVTAELLSIGDELLLGDITDTNVGYMARHLRVLGIRVIHFQTVGDELPDVIAAFKLALSRADVILATGGLGPTDDDLTLEAVAHAVGVPLEHREEVMDQMAARLKRPKEQLSGANRKQANIPKSAIVLRNDWGTAPGLRVPAPNGKEIFLMPGVPREMKGLFETWVVPILKERFPNREVLCVKQVHTFGVGESYIGEQIKDLMAQGRNPDVGTRVQDGTCTVRIVARAKSEAEGQALIAPVLARIREQLKAGLFGEDDETLVDATAKLLLNKKKTVAVAESCTAGLLAGLLGRVSGISASLLEGAVTYSNEAKVRTCGVKVETLKAHGAVSEETAKELAEGIRKRAGADFGVSVTGVAGPDGGTTEKPVGLFYVGIAHTGGAQAHRYFFPGFDRNSFRERAAMQALEMLRRAILV